MQCFHISGRTLLFGRFPASVASSFWHEQHVDDDYTALLEKRCEENIKVTQKKKTLS
jgi:hypothetical protein